MNKKIGITLGKMSPMHKGHEFLINQALEVVDILYVVLYHTPDLTSIPLNTRASWINQLYDEDKVKVITGWFAPNEHEPTDEVKRMQEQYIGNLMKDIKLSHFISSEKYGEHMSQYLGVENICQDIDRREIGICATDIRKDLKKNKKYLSPHVYFDLLQKFLIVGDKNTIEEYYKSLKVNNQNFDIENEKEFKKIHQYNLENIKRRSLNRMKKLKSNEILGLDDSIIIPHSILNDIIDSSKKELVYSDIINKIIAEELSNFDHIIVTKEGDPIYISAIQDLLNANKIRYRLLDKEKALEYFELNHNKPKIFNNE